MYRKLSTLFLAVAVMVLFCQPASAADKIHYPQKGRVLSIIAPLLEKKMGIPVQVVNKAGAGTQVGMTELTSAKPDGYTILLGHFPGTGAGGRL